MASLIFAKVSEDIILKANEAWLYQQIPRKQCNWLVSVYCRYMHVCKKNLENGLNKCSKTIIN